MADDTFGIAVELNPGDTVAKAKQVEDSLAKAEAAARRAAKELRDGMSSAARAFAPLAEAVRQHHEAMGRLDAVHDRIRRENDPLANSFRGIAMAIKQEHDAYDRINAPAKQYAEHLATLDRLLDKDRISTEQYAAEVAKLNRELAETPRLAAQRPADPSRGLSLMGFQGGPANRELGTFDRASQVGGAALSALSGPTAIIGGTLAAGHMVEGWIRDEEQLEDAYTKLTNKAALLAGDARDVNIVFREQQEIAKAIGTTLGPAMALYDDVGDATRAWGITTKEQIALTKALADDMRAEEKPLDEAGRVLQRLGVAFQSGTERGTQFKQIMENYPDLAKSLAAGFRVSEGELVKLIDTGKIGMPEIDKMIIANADAFHKAAQTQKLDNEQLRAIAIENINIAHQQGASLRDQVMALQQVTTGFRKANLSETLDSITTSVRDQIVEWKRVEDAAAAALRDQIVDGAAAATTAVKGLSSGVTHLADSLLSDGFYAIVKAGDPWFVKPETPKRVHETAKAVEELAAKYEYEARTQEKFENDLLRIRRELEERAQRERDDARARESKNAEDSINAQIKAHEDWANAVAKYTDEAAAKREDFARKETENAEKVKEQWAAAAGQMAGSLIKAAGDSETKWNDVIDQLLTNLAKLALQQAATAIGGPGGAFLGGIISGFASGGSFTVPMGGPGVIFPHAASGGSWTVGGSGATDSKLAVLHVSPREEVTVATEQQQAMRRRGSEGGSPQSLRVDVVLPDDRALRRTGRTYGEKRAAVELDRELFGRRRKRN